MADEDSSQRAAPEDDPGADPDVRIISTNRRYTLTDSRNGYQVWDQQDMSAPLAEFDMTEGGFEEADRLYRSLGRGSRYESGRIFRIAKVGFFGGLIVWLFTQVVQLGTYLLLVLGLESVARSWLSDGLVGAILFTMGNVAFVVWVASLVVLVLVWGDRHARDLTPLGPPGSGMKTAARVLLGAGSVGALVWITGSLLIQWFPIKVPDPFESGVWPTSWPQTVSSIGYRLLISSLVLLGGLVLVRAIVGSGESSTDTAETEGGGDVVAAND